MRRPIAAAAPAPPSQPFSLVGAVTAGCTAGRPILANATAPLPSLAPPTDPPVRAADPLPVVLPRDDGPHDRLSEWWYYTGHLDGTADDGTKRKLGFEYVIFRAERGGFPTAWASHLAITDETGDRFLYGQRLEVGEQVDRSPAAADGTPTGFDLSLSGVDPTDPATFDRPAWTMNGSDGTDRLERDPRAPRSGRGREPGRARRSTLDLEATKPAALHDRDGWIDFGPAGSSYYYSRTAMDARGTVTLDGQELAVTGQAWFDHQWGDFISVGGGGWDWFAVNLDDGTDLTLSLVRDADGSYPADLRDDRRSGRPHPPPRARRLQRRGHRSLDEPGDRRRLPGGLDDLDPERRRPAHRPPSDRRRAGARHARDHGRRVLGGLTGRPRHARGDADRRRRRMWS